MTQKEAAASLKADCLNTNCQYLTVVREKLLLALGGKPKATDDGPTDDEPAHEVQ